jgi:putative DNA primase/helicase
MKIDEIVEKLVDVKKDSNGWTALCPAHADKHRSLSVAVEGGKLLMHCFRGCRFEDILRSLSSGNLTPKNESPKQQVKTQKAKIVETYDYTDESGNLLYQIVRYEEKRFAIKRPDGNGGWIWKGDVKKVLYHLPNVKDTIEKNGIVIFVEGEKDVKNVVAKLGLCATTSPLGAGNWKDEYADLLKGANVVIVPDNDESGENYAQTVANSIYGKAQSVKIVRLPDLSEKEDVSDWIERGGNRERLLELVADSENWNLENTSLIPRRELEEIVIEGQCADHLIKAHLTDTGNAECFLVDNEGKFKFNKTNKAWYEWNGVIWQEDKTNVVENEILKTIRSRQGAFCGAPTETEKDIEIKGKSLKYLTRCEDVRHRTSIKQAVELLPQFISRIAEYDRDLFLSATRNGTLDLRSAKFRSSRQEDMMTLQFGTHYDAEADCPRWKQFLAEIFNDDEEMIDFIQRIAGYSLTGDISEQVMFILYGFGKNGKTVFSSVMSALLGDYAGTASFSTFDADKKSEQTNDLAILKGKRIVLMSESSADRRLNEPLIKQVTGGDEITCRFLFREHFTYIPQFKLFLATNHKPVITQSDFGIWRRIVLIPFTQNFDGREDPNLKEQLISELPGILNWAIEGLKKWQAKGLKHRPKAVTQATERYKKDSDTIGQWFELRMQEDTKNEIKSSDAYNDYKTWAMENGHYPVSNKTFKSSLEERGFFQKGKKDANYWLGFGFAFKLA